MIRINDILIDLNDLWGRLIPGLVAILDLYLVPIDIVDQDALIRQASENTVFSIAFFVAVLIVAHIIGELCLHPIFRLRQVLPRPTARENIKFLDPTADKRILRFYEDRFADRVLDASGTELLEYCKSGLLHISPNSYAQSRRIEARVNLQGGLIFPLVALIAIAFSQERWIVGSISVGLLLAFGNGFRRSFSREPHAIYQYYYDSLSFEENDPGHPSES